MQQVLVALQDDVKRICIILPTLAFKETDSFNAGTPVSCTTCPIDYPFMYHLVPF
jgi:hypothetical protein